VIRDGKIAAIGRTVDVPADAKVVELAGRHVYPSLFRR
jgi:imidazolonepropionase-like amidohydrolase